ncbi:MAG TPA: AgmX/PglI C-terminal domain-containing protein [Polyangia bacterium]|nr:AgmX/PglI C-terminal domain-containing protein [Polyangia bacterium]
MQTPKHLRVVLIWHGTILEEQTLDGPQPVTIGPQRRCTFVVPKHPALPKRFVLLQPGKQGYMLTLGPGMRGKLSLGDEQVAVEDFLESASDKKGFRATPVGPGDWGMVSVDEAGELQVFFQFVSPPERIPQRTFKETDRFLVQAIIFAGVLHAAILILALLTWEEPPTPPLEITPERFAKYFVTRPPEEEGSSPTAKERKKREDEGQSKRMKGEEGKLGRQDAKAKDTVIPKGEKDVLREKVAKRGLLAVLGNTKAGGSGLSKLLSSDTGDVEQAINGLAGANLVVGKGTGGLSTRGTGTGGGGTGMGHILGTGELDTGGGHGHGHGGPGLGTRKEHEVKVDVQQGAPDTDGSLSREQINRVVMAHKAAIRYCYEKELQRLPHLAGKIDLYWVILPDGSVQKANISSSTMGNAGVEGCMVRQVKQWQFPKSEGQTVVQRYPFVFKGGL